MYSVHALAIYNYMLTQVPHLLHVAVRGNLIGLICIIVNLKSLKLQGRIQKYSLGGSTCSFVYGVRDISTFNLINISPGPPSGSVLVPIKMSYC